MTNNKNTDRETQIMAFFLTTVNSGLSRFIKKGKEKFKITPAEFFGCFLALLSANQKYYTVKQEDTLKDLFDVPEREKLVDFFYDAFQEAPITRL